MTEASIDTNTNGRTAVVLMAYGTPRTRARCCRSLDQGVEHAAAPAIDVYRDSAQ